MNVWLWSFRTAFVATILSFILVIAIYYGVINP